MRLETLNIYYHPFKSIIVMNYLANWRIWNGSRVQLWHLQRNDTNERRFAIFVQNQQVYLLSHDWRRLQSNLVSFFEISKHFVYTIIWNRVFQSWLFFHEFLFWTKDRVRAVLTAVPKVSFVTGYCKVGCFSMNKGFGIMIGLKVL